MDATPTEGGKRAENEQFCQEICTDRLLHWVTWFIPNLLAALKNAETQLFHRSICLLKESLSLLRKEPIFPLSLCSQNLFHHIKINQNGCLSSDDKIFSNHFNIILCFIFSVKSGDSAFHFLSKKTWEVQNELWNRNPTVCLLEFPKDESFLS